MSGNTQPVMSISLSPYIAALEALEARVLLSGVAVSPTVVDEGVSPDVAVVDAAIAPWAAQADVVTEPIQTFVGHTENVFDVAISPNGQLVATGSADNTARIWNAATGLLLQTLDHPADIRSVAFTPDGSQLVTGGEDGVARLWNVSTGELVRSFIGHTSMVEDVVVSADGTRLVTAGHQDGTAKLWNLATGDHIRTFDHPEGREIDTIALSPDGTRLLTCGLDFDRIAYLWNVDTGAVVDEFSDISGDQMTGVGFSPDGERVFTANLTNVRVWSIDTGHEVFCFAVNNHGSVEFSADGTRLLINGEEQDNAQLWDLTTGQLLRTFDGHSEFVYAATFSSDGLRIATASADGTAKLWQAADAVESPSRVKFIIRRGHNAARQRLTIRSLVSTALALDISRPAAPFRFVAGASTDPLQLPAGEDARVSLEFRTNNRARRRIVRTITITTANDTHVITLIGINRNVER